MLFIDYAIVVVYLIALIGIGLYLQRRAGSSIGHFFLGDNKIPWWALGASGMASNLDVSGTMIIAALIYALGVQGFYIEIRGGVVLLLAFFMITMGKWNRRAKVMTLAEWMEYRFGSGFQGQTARVLAAVANLAFAIATVTYFAQGAGIFLGEILGIPADAAAIGMIALASIYTIASGLYGVVYTDVFQGFFVFGAIAYVIYLVVTGYPIPQEFAVSVPMGDGSFREIMTTREAWTDVIPDWKKDLPGTYGQYSLFGIGILFYLMRSCIDGMSGTGGYVIQRFYAAKNEREAGLLSMFWILLLSLRWPFVISIAIMGISYGASNQVIANPEEVLPIVILEMIPTGLKGLLVAGLIAAAMSTFDSVVNAGAAYWVRDIYQRFLKPEATEKRLVWHSRAATAVIVVVGMLSTYAFESLNDVWGWLTMGLGTGLIVPQMIRWYWWRFNGYGYAGGTVIGMSLAILQQIFLPELSELWIFVGIGSITFIACIVIALMTPPTDEEVLDEFYRETKPFGFWNTVRDKIDALEIKEVKKENRRDIAGLFLAVPWQLVLFLTTMMFVTREWDAFLTLLGVLIVLSVALYLVWYRHLPGAVDLALASDGPEEEAAG
ncbi:sodium:solute symporter [Longibacter salinarum]|uniref:Sodium:solute symporter n=1 Tax=Longibacter salinarum TaxID=1850348 RepID=A0A2A8D017_9BACT|nr:sodium:solute symporter [Longibacter salinarum]PEN14234.1 sodium:solute symporter [Longibacter salinarum]